MREATATPSEVHVPPPAPSSQSQARKNPHSAAMTMGSTPEITQDPSSETEMVNYSSGEDEPGIHVCIIVYFSSVGRTTRVNNFRILHAMNMISVMLNSLRRSASSHI